MKNYYKKSELKIDYPYDTDRVLYEYKFIVQ